MRLVAKVFITVPVNVVTRDPTFLERIKRGLGGRLDLETAEVTNQLEATAVVDAVRRALGKLGVGNALSLVIDDTVIFQDTDGRADDLPDLVLALGEHASLFGRGFRELRFAAEHEEAGLHLVVETRARTRHRRDEPAAAVSVGGRIRLLEAQTGESAEAYRARVEPLTKDAGLFETARLSFESFVARLTNALRAALPEATVADRAPEARLVKAPEREVAIPAPDGPRALLHPGYDPFAIYYPSPMGVMLDAMLFTSFMHMMMPPPILVVSPGGYPLGSMTEVQAQPDLAADDVISHHDHPDSDQAASAVGGDFDDGGSGNDGVRDDGDGDGDGDGDSTDAGDDLGGGGWDDGGGGGWDDGGGGDGGGGGFGDD